MTADFYKWLMDHVRDGGSNSLSALSEFALHESELLFKSPAMAAMLAWGEEGCEAVVKTALANPRPKTLSVAYTCLSTAAHGDAIDPVLLLVENEELIAAINSAIAGRRLQTAARKGLLDLIQSLNADDLLMPLETAFTQMGMSGGHIASELVRAMSSRWFRIGPSVIAEYESLIRANSSDEPSFQRFFSQHPQLLDPTAVEVWSQPDFHGAHEPDFVIRRADNSYLVVDIETPGQQLIAEDGQLSAEVTQAERQVTNYRAFLKDHVFEARQHFPYYQDADCLLVIGLETNLTRDQSRSLANANAGLSAVKIVGFDWLAKRAHAIVENVSAGEIKIVDSQKKMLAV